MTTPGAPWWRRGRARGRLRRAAVAGALVVSLALVAGGWVGFRAWQARDNLLAGAELARELSAQVVGGDVDGGRKTLAELQERAAAARRATGDPGWAVARRMPLAGDDLTAVRQVAVTVDELAREAFPRL